MADPLGDMNHGDISPFLTSFSTVNRSLGLLRQVRDEGLHSGDPGKSAVNLPPATRVYVRNDTGADLSPGYVVKLGAAVTSFTGDYQSEFGKKPVFKGTQPAATTDLCAILTDPIAKVTSDGTYSMGRAVVQGTAVCDVNITDTGHGYATPTASDYTKLTSAASGPILILDKESTGTGTKKCSVMLTQVTPSSSSLTFGCSSTVTGAASSGGSGDGSTISITLDATWTSAGVFFTPSQTGTWLFMVALMAEINISSGGPGGILARLYDTTGGAAVGQLSTAAAPTPFIAEMPNASGHIYGWGTLLFHANVTSGHVIRLEVLRTTGPTWTTASILGAASGHPLRIHAIYLP